MMSVMEGRDIKSNKEDDQDVSDEDGKGDALVISGWMCWDWVAR